MPSTDGTDPAGVTDREAAATAVDAIREDEAVIERIRAGALTESDREDVLIRALTAYVEEVIRDLPADE